MDKKQIIKEAENLLDTAKKFGRVNTQDVSLIYLYLTGKTIKLCKVCGGDVKKALQTIEYSLVSYKENCQECKQEKIVDNNILDNTNIDVKPEIVKPVTPKKNKKDESKKTKE